MSESDVAMEVRKRVIERARIVRNVRRFFERRAYVEIETPRLVPDPIPERYIDLFETRLASGAGGGASVALYLLPSPERYMKVALAAGCGNVFEFARAFRNGESTGPHHSPEFTMLEWYTVGADASDSLALTVELLQDLGVPGRPVNVTMREAFARYAGIDLEGALDRPGMAKACERAGLTVARDETWEDLFQRAFLTLVEPGLPADAPLFLTEYPAAIPTLARTGTDPRWAERWELYLAGIEVANCYAEETDPERISAFLKSEHAAITAASVVGSSLEQTIPPQPDRFLTGDAPLPACSGVALGVDRLVMHLLGAETIAEVSLFSLSAMIAAQQNQVTKT